MDSSLQPSLTDTIIIQLRGTNTDSLSYMAGGVAGHMTELRIEWGIVRS